MFFCVFKSPQGKLAFHLTKRIIEELLLTIKKRCVLTQDVQVRENFNSKLLVIQLKMLKINIKRYFTSNVVTESRLFVLGLGK